LEVTRLARPRFGLVAGPGDGGDICKQEHRCANIPSSLR
jgi:hypothetical protein